MQKAKTALYKKGILFESKMIDGSEPVASEFAALWPIQRFPVIVDDGQFVFETTGRAVRLGNQCSRPPTHFSTAAWPVGPGRSGRTSASPTARLDCGRGAKKIFG